jgi:hypothetical protein
MAYEGLISFNSGSKRIMTLSTSMINDRLMAAGHLEYRPVYVYGSATVPKGAVQVASVLKIGHRCIAKAILKQSLYEEVPPIFIGKDALKGCCYGAQSWLGFIKFPKSMEDMLTGKSDEEAMFLKSSPDVCRRSLKNIGKITPPADYVVMSPAAGLHGDEEILSVVCFGSAEQIRNLCALVHFNETRIFDPVMAPWGSHCSLFVAYPAGMAENAPKNTAFLGPNAPDGNTWFPEDIMALSMPMSMAARICEDYESSFAVKAPEMTYPQAREKV